jgi:hypothetical protein
MPMLSEDPGPNPYAPPSPAVENQPLPQLQRRSPWLFGFCCLQLIVLAGGIALDAYKHETVLGSGPAYLLVGLVTALLARHQRQPLEMLLGMSAILLVVGVFLRIVINEWGPEESNGPNTLVILAYATAAVPALLVAMVRKFQWVAAREVSTANVEG